MSSCRVAVLIVVILCLAALSHAQPVAPLDPPLVNWPAPPYWSPSAARHMERPQALSAQAPFPNRDVLVESTPETPLTGALPYVAVTPCRLIDTRHAPHKDLLQPDGSTPAGFPRGSYGNAEIRSYDLTSSTDCTGLPPGVGAWSLQFQFTTMGGSGVPAYLVAWPYDNGHGVGGQAAPANESTMLGSADRWTVNSAVIPAGNDAKGSINVFVQYVGDVIVEVNGYYGPGSVVTSLTGGGSPLTGDVTLAAGSNVDISPSSNTLTISMTGAPGGTLPAGTAGQTLRSNGSGWLANSFLYNNGSAIGINTTSPAQTLDVNGTMRMPLTTGSTSGVLYLGSDRFLHNYGPAGAYNTFVGTGAGNFTMGGTDPEGKYNTASGSWSLSSNTTGSENTASGTGGLQSNTTGVNNTASGAWSLQFNTTGCYNTASGDGSLWQNTTGSDNTASGAGSLNLNTTGFYNTAIGDSSLLSNTTGSRNAAIGLSSLVANTTASRNTALGEGALFTQSYDNGGTPWDADNTAVGCWAMTNNNPDSATDGYRNTAVGSQSLYSNVTGSNNIAAGYNAGYNLTTGDWNIDIGNQGVADEANTIRIGDSLYQTNTYIAGISGVTIAGGSTVLIDSSGHLGAVLSSLRFKQDVAAMGEASSRLMELRPVTFHYRTQPEGPLQYGLIAEEVNEVMPQLVVRDATGQVESVAYHELPAMLLNELQKQRATIEAQEAQIESRDAKVNALEARLAAIEARLAAK